MIHWIYFGNYFWTKYVILSDCVKIIHMSLNTWSLIRLLKPCDVIVVLFLEIGVIVFSVIILKTVSEYFRFYLS